MSKYMPKGGYRKKVPYTTKTLRIPTDLEKTVDEMCTVYRQLIFTQGEPVTGTVNISTIDEVIETANKILKTRVTKKQALKELICFIYGVNEDEINLD